MACDIPSRACQGKAEAKGRVKMRVEDRKEYGYTSFSLPGQKVQQFNSTQCGILTRMASISFYGEHIIALDMVYMCDMSVHIILCESNSGYSYYENTSSGFFILFVFNFLLIARP